MSPGEVMVSCFVVGRRMLSSSSVVECCKSCVVLLAPASRNVVELLMREQFDAGLCPPHKSSADEPTAETTKSDGFVYGWDC